MNLFIKRCHKCMYFYILRFDTPRLFQNKETFIFEHIEGQMWLDPIKKPDNRTLWTSKDTDWRFRTHHWGTYFGGRIQTFLRRDPSPEIKGRFTNHISPIQMHWSIWPFKQKTGFQPQPSRPTPFYSAIFTCFRVETMKYHKRSGVLRYLYI